MKDLQWSQEDGFLYARPPTRLDPRDAFAQSTMAKSDEKSGKRGLSTFKLVLIVLILLLIPTTMEQLEAHEETVRAVGRACVGLALLFFLYGLISKAMRVGGVILLLLIVARGLANEGVVEVPKLRGKISAERLDRSSTSPR